MRLTDADKYCEFLNTYPLEKAQSNVMTFYRDALQYTFECEVDAELVRHGHWEKPYRHGVVTYDEHAYAECSYCHKPQYLARGMNYCPNCGAKMDEEQENE